MVLARSAAIIVALLIGLFAMPAVSSTLDVHADYLDNGVIDRPHDPADLRAALEAAAGDAQYAGLAAAITDALEKRLLGRVPDTPGPVPVDGADRTALGVLPAPRSVEDSGTPPWPLLGLALLAGALVMTGVGSSVYRRAHSGR